MAHTSVSSHLFKLGLPCLGKKRVAKKIGIGHKEKKKKLSWDVRKGHIETILIFTTIG